MAEDRHLLIELDGNWEAVAGPKTCSYMRKGRINNNALQVSIAVNNSNARLQIEPEELIVAWVQRIGGSNMRVSPCQSQFGKMVTVTFSAGDFAHCRAWFSTDGMSTIQATFICDGQPSDAELTEVSQMARSMRLAQAKPTKKSGWWPF